MDFQATLAICVMKELLTYEEAQAIWSHCFGKIPPKTLWECIVAFERALAKK